MICRPAGSETTTFWARAPHESAVTARKESQILLTSVSPSHLYICGAAGEARNQASRTAFVLLRSFSLRASCACIARSGLFAASVPAQLVCARCGALYGGAMANVVEHQLAIADRAASVSHWERLHAINNFAVHEHFTFLRHLKEEDLALVGSPVAVGK